jgi:phosphocarrier protein
MVIQKSIQIVNRLGLHARPAALVVQTASRFSSKIELQSEDLRVNAKSIMGVMMLAAGFGSTLEVIADGDDAEEAVLAIEKLFEDKFNEE